MSDKKFYETVCKTQEYKNKVKQLQKQNQQLKSTLEEIIEYIKINTKEEYENIEVDEHFASILQIINKGDNYE